MLKRNSILICVFFRKKFDIWQWSISAMTQGENLNLVKWIDNETKRLTQWTDLTIIIENWTDVDRIDLFVTNADTFIRSIDRENCPPMKMYLFYSTQFWNQSTSEFQFIYWRVQRNTEVENRHRMERSVHFFGVIATLFIVSENRKFLANVPLFMEIDEQRVILKLSISFHP